jgi:hypothetical protein
MKVFKGDRFREKSSGQIFVVWRIEGKTILLVAEDRPNKFLLGDGIMDLLFDRAES